MQPSLLMNALERVFQLVDSWGMSPVVAGGLAVAFGDILEALEISISTF